MFLNDEVKQAKINFEVAKGKYDAVMPGVEAACKERFQLLTKIAKETYPGMKTLSAGLRAVVGEKEEGGEKYKLEAVSEQLDSSVAVLEKAVNAFSAELAEVSQAYTKEHGIDPTIVDEFDTAALASGLGVAAGGATVALAPAGLMAVATTFGTTGAGVAISSLSGVAATNAALAWLGGGALAAGGGGIAAGEALLALMGPVGWAIAGVSVLVGGWWYRSKNQETIDKLEPATVELTAITEKFITKTALINDDRRAVAGVNTNLLGDLTYLNRMVDKKIIDEHVISDIRKACAGVEELAAYMSKRLSFGD